jgi:hypothetical protein
MSTPVIAPESADPDLPERAAVAFTRRPRL